MAFPDEIIGCKVKIEGNDILNPIVSGVIRGIDRNSQSLLLEFIPPIEIGTHSYPIAVAHPRLHGEDLMLFFNKGSGGFSVIFVPGERYDPAMPFDTSWWRGGEAMIAYIKLITP